MPRGRPKKSTQPPQSKTRRKTLIYESLLPEKEPPKFEITPIDEDMHAKQVARLLQIPESTLIRRLNRLGMGYRREGAGMYRFIRKEEFEILKGIFKRKDL